MREALDPESLSAPRRARRGISRAVLATALWALGGIPVSKADSSNASMQQLGTSRLEVGGVRLLVPHEYLPDRLRTSTSDWTSLPLYAFSFAFLMPDGDPARHVNLNWIGSRHYPLRYSDRGPGRFLVNITKFYVIATDDKYVSPAQGFRNLMSVGRQPIGQEFGLDFFSERPNAKATYGAVQQTEPEVLFTCKDQESADKLSPGLTPLCNGIAYYPSRRFEYRLSFPAENFPEWRRVVDTAHRLVVNWTENSR